MTTSHRTVRARIALVAIAACVLAGCGSARAASTRAKATIPFAGPGPSPQTRMICAPEAQHDLATTLGLETVRVSPPTWRGNVYSCAYDYRNGSYTLSVHQAADAAGARATLAVIAHQLTRRTALQGLGADAFTTADGSVVVEKDADVLVVDITKLPARFGVPADTRANAAISIAATIMGCWTGS
jgi:hypothetical protein